MQRLQPYPVAIALSFVFLVLYLACVALHYFLPASSTWQMSRLWEMVLFGFTWLTTTSLFLGLLEVVIAGFYVAYTLVPFYNFFDRRFTTREGGQVMRPLRFKPIALALTSFALITYVLCFAFDLVFPQWAMTEIWRILLPGFTGLNASSFFIGLVGVAGYGLYVSAVFVPIYNFFRSDQLPELK